MNLNEEETKAFFKWLDEPPSERQFKISALLEEIAHEDEWDMMTENNARNTLLFYLRDIKKHPETYNDTRFFDVINKIQEVFKRENIAR